MVLLQTDVPSHLNFSYHWYCFAFSRHYLLKDESMFPRAPGWKPVLPGGWVEPRCKIPAALTPQQKHEQGTKGTSLQHAQETQSSLPQGWAWPAQDSTREGWQNPWAGLWESAGFPFSSCCPLGCKTADTKTASPWITCPCLCYLSPITAHPRVQPATHEVHHWSYPSFSPLNDHSQPLRKIPRCSHLGKV